MIAMEYILRKIVSSPGVPLIFHIEGKAGSGKSLIQVVLTQTLINLGWNVVNCTLTNLSRQNLAPLEAITFWNVHHLRPGVVENDVEFRINPLSTKGQALLMVNCLIYEECSMMSTKVINACDYRKCRVGISSEKFPCEMFFGNLYQLQAVIKTPTDIAVTYQFQNHLKIKQS